MSELQTIDNQRGEIDFRRKLVQQQVDGQQLFTDEFDSREIERILKERMDSTRERMQKLLDSGLTMSPYVEIGAERGQRSLIMESDLNQQGAAIDLSFDMLRSCEHYKTVFEKNKLPLRICGDLYLAPFKTDSIPFVFCYQTLHHFPNPEPIVEEVRRFLAPGGCFFFNEEPFKKGFHLKLYRTDKVFSDMHLRRRFIRKLFDHFFAEYVCNEVEHGVIENDDITIRIWREVFSRFDEKDVKLSSFRSVTSDLYGRGFSLNSVLNYLWGGSISGICRKAGDPVAEVRSIESALTCPVCLKGGNEPELIRKESIFSCEGCESKYPVVNDVLFLLAPDKLVNLYPEIDKRV